MVFIFATSPRPSPRGGEGRGEVDKADAEIVFRRVLNLKM